MFVYPVTTFTTAWNQAPTFGPQQLFQIPRFHRLFECPEARGWGSGPESSPQIMIGTILEIGTGDKFR